MAPAAPPISIVCVFNDSRVRRECLDRSLAGHDDGVDYIPVDNSGGAFASAGAALNHGASLARHDQVAFVHQDVHLHSLEALRNAAAILARDPGIGVLGAVGVASDGAIVGRVRDRVVLIGERVARPTEVDSLDEVVFIASRELLAQQPLADTPELAWHGYAVEYGLRARSLGLRVCAVDIPLTHNSLTVNLERLDLAYEAIAAAYPEALPVRATCGTIAAPTPARPGAGLVAPHRWRYRWLRESLRAHRARRAVGGGSFVLGDIRLDIDEVLAQAGEIPLAVVNCDAGASFADPPGRPLELTRAGRSITFETASPASLADRLDGGDRRGGLLLANLGIDELHALRPQLRDEPRLIGYRAEIGYWMLLGAAATTVAAAWRSPRAKPLGIAAIEVAPRGREAGPASTSGAPAAAPRRPA